MARKLALADLPDWPRVLSRDEAARYCGIAVSTLDREIDEGRMPPSRWITTNRRGWDRRQLDAWIDRKFASGPPARHDEEEDPFLRGPHAAH